MEKKFRPDIHADDYGYSINTSKDILMCLKAGKLDSISIISNMPAFDASMDMFFDEIENMPFLPKISVHINLVEGDMAYSWKDLFLISYSFRRNKVKDELKKVLKKQIDKVKETTDKCFEIAKKKRVVIKQEGLRIDSHVHTHLIPVVWDALVEVIEEEKYDVEFIRNPKEPMALFIKNIGLWHTYNVVNIIKNRILMLYSRKVDRYCECHKLDKIYMWGLIMSGKMDHERIDAIYDDMSRYAQKHDRNLEILFHPGTALEEEYCKEMNAVSSREFNMSPNRHIEKNAVENIKAIIGK